MNKLFKLLYYIWLLLLLALTIFIDIFVILFKMLSFTETVAEVELHLKKINKEDAIEFLEKNNIPINQIKGYYKLNTNTAVKKSYTPFLIEEIVNNKFIFLLKSIEYDFKLSFPIPKYLSIGIGYDFIAIIINANYLLFLVMKDA